MGATGSLGRALVREALDRGHGVSALCRERSRGTVDPRATVVRGDALERQSLRRLVRGTTRPSRSVLTASTGNT